jgi:hypothetical protein
MESKRAWFGRGDGLFAAASGLLFLVLVTMGLFTQVQAAGPPVIQKASWKASKETLTVKGKRWGTEQPVVLSDAAVGNVLGTVLSNRRGRWVLKLASPADVPCRVRAESGQNVAARDVARAPSACGAAPFTRVFAFNDLGMHCYDKDFATFAILPLFNVVHAQVIRRGAAGNKPAILDQTQASVFYSGVADRNGSINTTSAGKSNFWTHVGALFQMSPAVDEGLLGARMPGTSNAPQPFGAYDPQNHWFAASGIPITNWDDAMNLNPYPLLRIQVFDIAAASTPPPTFVVVPASEEMHCSGCHATEGTAADEATRILRGIPSWSGSADPETQYRENVLILHDAKHATGLMASRPVLCARCHYSPALDLAGAGRPTGDQVGNPLFSHAMHGRHGRTLANAIPGAGEQPVIPDTGMATCYHCHPGNVTQCLRGAMGAAGLLCQDCHGGLLAVGAAYALPGSERTPWLSEPKCQSCHTGDAVSHLGADIRLLRAYDAADPNATPTDAVNRRFAEELGKLYRHSLGHGGMACEACHGSPHAEWPVGDPTANDNVAAIQLQGHTGPIIECRTCHADGPTLTTNGPHGLHPVNDRTWNEEHKQFYEQNPSGCKACHGLALEGTVLSRTADSRSLLREEGRPISLAKGVSVSCTLCHESPLGQN